MRDETPQLWFRSDLFSIDPGGEDEETNPFCYGKQVAAWVHERFSAAGYNPEPIIPEDWGWCVMLERKPFMLWIGCGNDPAEFYERVKPEDKPDFVPQADKVVWSCIVGTDVPVWTPFFWRRLIGKASTQQSVARAADQLREFV